MAPPIYERTVSPVFSQKAINAMQLLGAFMHRLRLMAGQLGQGAPPGNLLQSFSENNINKAGGAILDLLPEVDFTMVFTNAGIPQGSSFSDEASRIFKSRILPYVYPPADAESVIRSLCNNKGDYALIEAIGCTVKAQTEVLPAKIKEEILSDMRMQARKALEIISYRIAALGMDEDVYIRAGRDDALVTPFVEQNREVNKLLEKLEGNAYSDLNEDLSHIKVMIRHCRESIVLIDKAAERNGASLRQTYILRKLDALINRLMLLLPVTCSNDTDVAFASLTALLKEVVLALADPGSLRRFVSNNISLIAYRITENKRKTGEHYITVNSGEYWDMFISACGGGFVVSFMVIIKLMIHHAEFPLFWESFFYGLNYALGFVCIHVLQFTLATKQPAMTAATIAASMDDIRNDTSRYHHLAATIAAASRSQIVSFAGNLLIAFPLTLLWVFILGLLLHQPFITADEGNKLLHTIGPFNTFSVWYAAIAGVLLFCAGIISGFGDNKVVVSRIGERLEAHPVLRKYLGAEKLYRLSVYIEKNLGPLLGNIIFGFMLAITAFIGKITGLPIDIRHITFSTGNSAAGLMAVNFNVSWLVLFSTFTGVVAVGVVNFAVSFLLALQVAARSRGLRLKDYPDMMAAVWDYFKKQPAHFFYPPRNSQ
jgi:site-specific recombinase